MSATSLLALEGLTVRYAGADPARPALDGFDLELRAGEIVALLGESGGGKTTAGLAVPALLPASARTEGRILWRGVPVDDSARVRLRGREIGLTFQDPLAALDPVWTVGAQLRETLRRLRGLDGRAADRRARELLAEVRLPVTDALLDAYAHALSGGQRQRVLLALALAGDPSLLIADEPTTALDAPLRRGVLDLLVELSRTRGLSVLLITHDAATAARVADRIVHLQAGRCVAAPPPQPATAVPAAADVESACVLRCRSLSVDWPGRSRVWGRSAPLRAVHAVDLDVQAGETVGLVGESGCGKTSLARAVCGFADIAEGAVTVASPDGPTSRRTARAAQLVFQDPSSALDPRQTVFSAVLEGAVGGGETKPDGIAAALLARVGLGPELWARRPHGLSGGQRQRVVLARALAARPALLVADEPTASLDPAARDAVLVLLAELQREQGWGLLLISHDLSLVRRLSARTAVMLAGRLVEVAPSQADLRHPYSKALLAAAVDEAGRERPRTGCPWFGACDLAEPRCAKDIPSFSDSGRGHLVRCPNTAGNGGTR